MGLVSRLYVVLTSAIPTWFLRSAGTTGVPVGCSVGTKIAPAAELGEIGADYWNSWNSGPE